jgi:hypothetical protein
MFKTDSSSHGNGLRKTLSKGCRGFQKKNGLNEEEIARLWSILDNYPKQPSVFFFKLLLLTGESKNE